MAASKQTVWLEYGPVGKKKLLENLSGATLVGDCLWTVSDEGRTIEGLAVRGKRVFIGLRGPLVSRSWLAR